nr:MAG TPA: baseplate protein [Caudoviricetes sp.]
MEEIMRAMIGKIDTCIIAKIVKVESGFVDVEPQAEYKSVMLPPILHVPMCQLGNRQLKMKIKFKAGDIVPVLICSRDISGYISKETAVMNTNKRHNLSNAIALPLLISTDINTENFPGSIEIDGDVVLNGNFTVNGDVKITGKLQVGSIESGPIKAESVDTDSGVSKGGTPYIHP